MDGIELARRFYLEVVAPIVDGVPHGAALLGYGSEVLGLDDAISADHDFGPRLQLFIDEPDARADIGRALERQLPDRFAGHPVAFSRPSTAPPRHQIEVTTCAGFFDEHLGFDPAQGVTLPDWLLSPTQRLATMTAGAVFNDPDGELASRRATLRWYPDDVWRYVLAAAWLRVSQEHAFVGRTGARGDDRGSRVLAARQVRELMRLAFLIERRWAPYSKWLGVAFAQLPIASEIGPHLDDALRADDWRARETALGAAAERLGHATNDLELAAPIDPRPRPFFDRDIRVIDAEGLTEALCAAISDAEVVRLLERLGARKDRAVGRLPGAIDQAVDSTDVLSHVGRCRASASMLGLLADDATLRR